jgi:asparagine synthase (glutamine-hydrolysing)
MCGIVGFTAPGRPDEAHEALGQMLGPIRHRGPDSEGRFVDEGVAFGHLRLAIIDLAGGAQPRVDAEGNALLFNGEIYGYRRLAEALRAEGVELADRSDTEVLFHLLKARGIEATLAAIDGMFAFAWREGGSGRLWLARDRFGEKPLFYGTRGGRLVFASEVRALRRHPLYRDAGIDEAAIAPYLMLGYVPDDGSGFDGVKRLPPGSALMFDGVTARVEPYWRPRPADAASSAREDEEERVDRLEALLSQSVADRLVADVPVGIFLSGGVDSSLVAAMAARHSASVTAYSVRMPEASFDETPYAREAARHLGLRHEVVELGEADLVDAYDTVMAKIDEPLADPSLIPTYLVCRAARRSVTVALGGDGADELFAGYPNFAVRRYAGAMARLPRAAGAAFRRLLGAIPASRRYMGLDFRLRQLSYGFGAPPDAQSYHWMAMVDASEQGELLGRPGHDIAAAVERWLGESQCRDALARLLYLFTVTYLPHDILTKVDRASMYNSLEVRAPFLARGFADHALSLAVGDKLRGGEKKYLLKRLARRHLPASIVDRPKHGFALPLAEELRHRLQSRVEAILFDRGNPLLGYFARPALERAWREHQSGARDHHRKLWAIAVLMRVAAG